MSWNRWLFFVGALLLIALGTTAASLAIQGYFGRSALLALVSTLVAAVAAGLFAMWGPKRV